MDSRKKLLIIFLKKNMKLNTDTTCTFKKATKITS